MAFRGSSKYEGWDDENENIVYEKPVYNHKKAIHFMDLLAELLKKGEICITDGETISKMQKCLAVVSVRYELKFVDESNPSKGMRFKV